MPLYNAGTDQGNQSPHPNTTITCANARVKKAHPIGGRYPRPKLAIKAANGISI